MSSQTLIANERLAFIKHAIDYMDEISILQSCKSNFKQEEICSGKLLLFQTLGKADQMPSRSRDGGEKSVQDIITLMKSTDPDDISDFVAKELHRLLPVTFDHIDVTRLLKDNTIPESKPGRGRKSFRTNAVTPDITVGPIWLYEEQPPSVEIIELNSSNEVENSPREKRDDAGNRNLNTCDYLDNHGVKEIEDRFVINKKAREKQRLQNEHFPALPPNYSPEDANNMNSNFANDFYTNHSTNHIDDELKFNQRMNCFTIFNRPYIDSDPDTSLDEDYNEVEIITSSDLLLDRTNWEPHDNGLYNEEIVTYGTDVDQETRTIWIYSYKNKHLISEDDFVVNNSSKEMLSTSTSHSTDSSGEPTADKSTSTCRLGSPVPPTYIPRLDLSLVPTLSTVTEISEPNVALTPKESNKSVNKDIKKPPNNWFVSESAKMEGAKSIRRQEKSTNIINWMGLSPRERRRVLKDKSTTDRWIGSRLNLVDNNEDPGEPRNDAVANDDGKVLVDVEVHADVNDRSDNNAADLRSSRGVPKTNYIKDVLTVNKIKYADEVCEEFQKDRGDHSVRLVVAPAIRLTPKKKKNTEITDPIEKLESSNWIREARDEKVTNVYDNEPELSLAKDDTAVDRLWMKNSIPFLQPSQWPAFEPITTSPVSYHLSLGSIEEKQSSWYTGLFKCLKCCK